MIILCAIYDFFFFFFFKQKTAYEMRISDWSSDVCSSDLQPLYLQQPNMFYFPGLAQRPFFERSDFDWSGAVEAATDAIRAELLAMVDSASDPFGPYVTASHDRPPPNNPLQIGRAHV